MTGDSVEARDPDGNDAFLRIIQGAPEYWKTDPWGNRYYDGPNMSGDGTIDWDGDGWPE